MVFKVDLFRYAQQLLPPILRGSLLLSLLRSFVYGVQHVQSNLALLREDLRVAQTTTSHTIVLEAVLNEALCLSQSPIYITTIADLGECIMYKADERRPVTLGRTYEPYRRTILTRGEVTPLPHITINIPDTIATSTDATKDLYQGRYLSMVRQLCDKYLPAGKQYNINIYKYA